MLSIASKHSNAGKDSNASNASKDSNAGNDSKAVMLVLLVRIVMQ